jgi:hypothetical protein
VLNNLMLSDPIPVTIGPVDFTLTPVLQANLALQAQGGLTGKPIIDLTQSAYASAGVQYNGGFSPIGGTGCDPPVPSGTPVCTTFSTPKDVPLGGQLQLSLGLNLMLVGAIDAFPISCGTPDAPAPCHVLGPVFGPELSLALAAQVKLQPQAPVWSLGLNLTAGVGFTANWQIGPVGLNLTFQANLINTTFTLAHSIEIDTKGQLPNAQVTRPYASPALSASGYGTPYAWSLGSGAPSWLSIGASSGVLSGIPPPSVANTNVSVPVKATDNTPLHISDSQTLTLPVGVPPMSSTSSSLPTATAGRPYAASLGAIGGVPPYSWSLQSGATLPSWLSLSPGGTLSGTPPNNSGNTSVPIAVQVTGKPGGPAKVNLSLPIGVPTFAWTTPDSPLSVGDLRGISCPSPTLCVAVSPAWTNGINYQTIGEAVVYANGTWTEPIEVDPSGGLNAISCPTTAFCMAVGDNGAAISYTNGIWSPPTTVEEPPTSILEVTCASPAFCVATDSRGHPIIYSNGAWGAPAGISLTAISCPAAGSCVGVDNSGNAYTYSSSAWSPGQNIDGTNRLTGVSCPTTNFCVATDVAGNALSDSNNAWSAPTSVNATCTSTTLNHYTCLGPVACASASFCMATGPGGYGPNTTWQYSSFVFNGSSWSTGPTVSEPQLTGYGGFGVPVYALSCPTAGFCATALGNSETAIYSSGQWSPEPVWLQYFGDIGVSCAAGSTSCEAIDSSGFAAAFDNGAWGTPTTAETVSSPVSVSCPTTSFCMAVDINGNVLSESNGAWSAPTQVDTVDQPSSISCPTVSFCMVSGYSGNVVRYSGGVWSAPEEIDSSATNQQIDSVSCGSPTSCVAVDASGNAFTYSNGTWSGPTDIDGKTAISDVSCPSASFCAAVDSKGNAIIYSNGAWAAPEAAAVFNGSFSTPSISCPSSNICVETGNSGDGTDAATYYYGAWSAPSAVADVEQNTNGWPNMLSCPTVNYCVALGGLNNDVASVGTLVAPPSTGSKPFTGGSLGAPAVRTPAARVAYPSPLAAHLPRAIARRGGRRNHPGSIRTGPGKSVSGPNHR